MKNANSQKLLKLSLSTAALTALGLTLSLHPHSPLKVSGPATLLQFSSTAPDCSITEIQNQFIPRSQREGKNAEALKTLCEYRRAQFQGRAPIVEIDGKQYHIKDPGVAQISGKQNVTLEAVDGNCTDLCNKSLSVNSESDLSKFADNILAEAKAQMPAAASGAEPSSAASETKVADIVKKYEDKAKECDEKSDSSKLSCHKSNLIGLSRELEDKKENADEVLAYYNDHIASLLKDLKPGRPDLSDSEGFAEYRESFEELRAELEDLIADLKEKNGFEVRKKLASLAREVVVDRVRVARDLRVTGLRETNPFLFDLGLDEYRAAQGDAWYFQDMHESFTDSISERPLRRDYASQYKSLFTDPTKNLFSRVTIGNLASDDTRIDRFDPLSSEPSSGAGLGSSRRSGPDRGMGRFQDLSRGNIPWRTYDGLGYNSMPDGRNPGLNDQYYLNGTSYNGNRDPYTYTGPNASLNQFSSRLGRTAQQ